MKAIEHFLSADESAHCDESKLKKNFLEAKTVERKTEAANTQQSKNNNEAKTAIESNKTMGNLPTSKPLNLTWDYSGRTDIFTPNWSSFRFGAGSTLVQNTASLPPYPNTILSDNPNDPLMTCFPRRPNFVHPPTISPFYYPSMPLQTPTYK